MTTPNAKPSGKTAQGQEQHTKGPWKMADLDYRAIEGPDGLVVADVRTHPGLFDSRRIVACVNYCEGVPIELLEGYPSDLKTVSDIAIRNGNKAETLEAERDALAAQNIELVEALRDLADKVHQNRMSWDQDDAHIQLEDSFRRAERLLAKLKP